MPHQVALTIRARVRPGQADDLKRLLAAMAGPAADRAIPFERLGTTHFARLFVLDEADQGPDGGAGSVIPASLVYMSDIDAPVWRHLVALVRTGGARLDAVLAHCEGWPSRLGGDLAAGRLAAGTDDQDRRRLRQHGRPGGRPGPGRAPAPPGPRGVPGRQAGRVARERPGPDPRRRPPVRGRPPRPALGLEAGPRPRARVPGPVKAPHGRWGVAGAALLAAVAGRGAALGGAAAPPRAAGRARRADPTQPRAPPRARRPRRPRGPEPVHRRRRGQAGPLQVPDHARPCCGLVNYATRHVFNHGSLARVRSIHFARWVAIDDRPPR